MLLALINVVKIAIFLILPDSFSVISVKLHTVPSTVVHNGNPSALKADAESSQEGIHMGQMSEAVSNRNK